MIAEKGRVIDLDSVYSPAVLAGLISVSVGNVYQLVQRGVLKQEFSYSKALAEYSRYLRDKGKRSNSDVAILATLRKSELDRAKVELTWLQVAKERGELVDKKEFTQLVSPVFAEVGVRLLALPPRRLFLFSSASF